MAFDDVPEVDMNIHIVDNLVLNGLWELFEAFRFVRTWLWFAWILEAFAVMTCLASLLPRTAGFVKSTFEWFDGVAVTAPFHRFVLTHVCQPSTWYI